MSSTLRQQFSPSLLTEVLQHVQLQVELFGSAADAGFGDLSRNASEDTFSINLKFEGNSSLDTSAYLCTVCSLRCGKSRKVTYKYKYDPTMLEALTLHFLRACLSRLHGRPSLGRCPRYPEAEPGFYFPLERYFAVDILSAIEHRFHYHFGASRPAHPARCRARPGH